jgi:hypothetical protein
VHVQTFIRKGLPGAAFLLLHEICPAGEDKTRVALAVAVQAAVAAIQLLVSSPQSQPSTSHCDITCASCMLFLSLAGSSTVSFGRTIRIMKFWAANASGTLLEGESRHMVDLSVICSAIVDQDVNDAQVVARWLSISVVDDARNHRFASVTQSSVWRHVVEWTQITGCFVCQRALEQLIAVGDWGQLMRVAHECSIHPQVILSFTQACAPDSVQKT